KYLPEPFRLDVAGWIVLVRSSQQLVRIRIADDVVINHRQDIRRADRDVGEIRRFRPEYRVQVTGRAQTFPSLECPSRVGWKTGRYGSRVRRDNARRPAIRAGNALSRLAVCKDGYA